MKQFFMTLGTNNRDPMPDNISLKHNVAYRIVDSLAIPRMDFPIHITGQENIPESGVRLYLVNHQNAIDVAAAVHIVGHYANPFVARDAVQGIVDPLALKGINVTWNKRGVKEYQPIASGNMESKLRGGHDGILWPGATYSPLWDDEVQYYKGGAIEVPKKMLRENIEIHGIPLTLTYILDDSGKILSLEAHFCEPFPYNEYGDTFDETTVATSALRQIHLDQKIETYNTLDPDMNQDKFRLMRQSQAKPGHSGYRDYTDGWEYTLDKKLDAKGLLGPTAVRSEFEWERKNGIWLPERAQAPSKMIYHNDA